MQNWFSLNAWPIGDLLGNYVAPLIDLAVGLGGLIAACLMGRKSKAVKRVEEWGTPSS